MGPLLPGAFDMAREARILQQIGPSLPLAPRALHLCTDGSVLGAPFQISEFRRGLSVRDQLPAPFAGDAAIGHQLSTMMVAVLAQLHRLDPDAVGLGDRGKPQGLLNRGRTEATRGGQGGVRPSTSRWATY